MPAKTKDEDRIVGGMIGRDFAFEDAKKYTLVPCDGCDKPTIEAGITRIRGRGKLCPSCFLNVVEGRRMEYRRWERRMTLAGRAQRHLANTGGM